MHFHVQLVENLKYWYCLTQNLYFSAQNSEGITRKAHEDLSTKMTIAELFTSKTNKTTKYSMYLKLEHKKTHYGTYRIL